MLLLRQQEIESAADTAYYGFVVLGATWIVFVVGMGSVLGVWEWAWDVPDVRIHFISSTAPIQWRGGGWGLRRLVWRAVGLTRGFVLSRRFRES